jgi:hypothetical protein
MEGGSKMILIPFVSYGGTHILNFELTAYDSGHQLILRDEQGYFGFITEESDLITLRNWLNKALEGK